MLWSCKHSLVQTLASYTVCKPVTGVSMYFIYGWHVYVNGYRKAAVKEEPPCLFVSFVRFFLHFPMSINRQGFYDTITFSWHLFIWIFYDF